MSFAAMTTFHTVCTIIQFLAGVVLPWYAVLESVKLLACNMLYQQQSIHALQEAGLLEKSSSCLKYQAANRSEGKRSSNPLRCLLRCTYLAAVSTAALAVMATKTVSLCIKGILMMC